MLTDLRCRQAKAAEKDYKIGDAGGLYLFVTTNGFRSWRWKYRFAAREKRLTLGGYPEVTLTKARELRDEARALLRSGTDPALHRKQRAAEQMLGADTTFRAVTLAWHQAKQALLKPRYHEQLLARFENHVFPAIGRLPIRGVTPALVLKVIRGIEEGEAHETAHRVRQHISDVFVFAIASGWADNDPANVIRKALVPAQKRLRPAATRIGAAREILRKSEARPAYAVTKLAARLLALTAARPGVVRLAELAEFEELDGARPLWRIPAAKMKLTRERREDVTYEFVIPLSRQAVEVVKVAIEQAGPGVALLFPSSRSVHRPISDSTLSKFYRDAGFTGLHVPHGWRSTFSTLMNKAAAEEERESDRAIVDLMLAHMPAGVEAVYNRYLYMPRRRAIAQAWADELLQDASSAAALVEAERGSSPRATARCRARDRRLLTPVDGRPAALLHSRTRA